MKSMSLFRFHCSDLGEWACKPCFEFTIEYGQKSSKNKIELMKKLDQFVFPLSE